MSMKVILLQKVKGLGETDDIKDVADGYAVNFLFPKHLAVPASQSSLHDLIAHKNKKTKDEVNDLKNQQKLASKLDGLELKFVEKVNDKGILYSAVNSQKIAKKLEDLGYKISKNKIIVSNIKTAGDFTAKVKFAHGLEADLNIIVSE